MRFELLGWIGACFVAALAFLALVGVIGATLQLAFILIIALAVIAVLLSPGANAGA